MSLSFSSSFDKEKKDVTEQTPIVRLSEVVSVCSNKDALTWQKASEQIVRNISADRYKVIVPDNEIDHFLRISNKKFEFVPESYYLPEVKTLLKNHMPFDKTWRLGWYLQQLLKIAALKTANDDETVLIWDADTVPLKPLKFIDDTGKLIFYKGIEHHNPYFQCIRRLLSLEKTVDFSFIAQCFVSKAIWVKDFCKDLEERFRIPWYEAIIKNIDFNEISGFAEYETLGTYYISKYLSSITFCDNRWERLGKSLIGSIAELTQEKILSLAQDFDFIAFEGWDPGNDKSPQTKRDADQFEAYKKALLKGKL